MSQPRLTSSHSTSPSKSSPRRNQNPSGRSLLPSPHFNEDPVIASQQDHSTQALASKYYAVEPHSAIVDHHATTQFPRFQPFFTLIEDRVTNEHHHPTVHYIFADDDADIITEAACRSLEQDEPASVSLQAVTSPTQSEQRQQQVQQREKESEPSRLPHPIPGVREHYLLLDVQPITSSGIQQHQQHQQHHQQPPIPSLAVTHAQSLSADWQVLRTSISTAPTMGDGPDDEDGLMLRIEGRGNTPPDLAARDKAGDKDGGARESVEEMIERFQKRLEDIRLIMEAAALPGEAVAPMGGGDGEGEGGEGQGLGVRLGEY